MKNKMLRFQKKEEIKQEKIIESKKEMKEDMVKIQEVKVENNNQNKDIKKNQSSQNNVRQDNYSNRNNKNYSNRSNNFNQDRNNRFNNERHQNFSKDGQQNSYRKDYRNAENNKRTDGKFNGDRNSNYRDRNNSNNNYNKFGDKNRRNNYSQNNGYSQGNTKFGNRPLDDKGIEKNIKNIMSVETGEKESVREYNKSIDKKKENNKFNENRNTKKRTRRNQEDYDINEGKLKNLKQQDKLSNMFEDQENSMLDYYDLTTVRGRKGKKKNTKDDESRTKQKIFKLTEITVPESISVKDLAQELKKTASEIIMKLMSLGIMATLNNDIDFDTAFLVAAEFGVTAVKKRRSKRRRCII